MLSNMWNRLFHKTIIVSATSKSFNISDPVNTNTVAVLTGPHATNRYKISLQRVQTEDLVACLIWNTKRTILIKKIINSKALILLFFEKSGRSTCIFFYLAYIEGRFAREYSACQTIEQGSNPVWIAKDEIQ